MCALWLCHAPLTVRARVRRWWYFLIAIVAAVLFTAFLIYDLQLLMGGGAHELSPDEYIFAACNIYLDVVQIFLNVLQIVGLASN
jgi:protein lifeguard